MSAVGLCILCGPILIQGLEMPGKPEHCYGTADQIIFDVIGGFTCSCPCREGIRPQPECAVCRLVLGPYERNYRHSIVMCPDCNEEHEEECDECRRAVGNSPDA